MMPRDLTLAAFWLLSCVFVWFGDVPRCTAADAGPIAAEDAGMAANWDLAPAGAGGTPVLAERAGACHDVLQPVGGRLPAGMVSLGVQAGDPEYLVAPVSDDLQLGPNL